MDLLPVGSERVCEGVVYRVVRYVKPSRVVDGRMADADPHDPDAREAVEPVGRVRRDGTVEYFPGDRPPPGPAVRSSG